MYPPKTHFAHQSYPLSCSARRASDRISICPGNRQRSLALIPLMAMLIAHITIARIWLWYPAFASLSVLRSLSLSSLCPLCSAFFASPNQAIAMCSYTNAPYPVPSLYSHQRSLYNRLLMLTNTHTYLLLRRV